MKNILVNGKNLEKIYHMNQGEKVHSIDGIDITIREGQFTVIMGDSGSGKSTLLYLLSGLEPATRGEIQINSVSINNMNESELAIFRRKNIGFVFQNINLIPNMTLLENLMLPGLLINRNQKEVMQNSKNLLEKFDLSSQANKLPAQMSGGQQQRGAIARALVNSPKIIFADEPTGNLNSSNSKMVIETLMKLHSEGQTIIMVTHDYKIAAYGDEVLYIRDGKIISKRDNCKSDSMEERESLLISWLDEKGW